MRFSDSEAGKIITALSTLRDELSAENKPYIQAVRAEVRSYEQTVQTLGAKKVVKFLGYTPMIMPELAKLVEKVEVEPSFPIYIGNETLFLDDLETVLSGLEETNTRG